MKFKEISVTDSRFKVDAEHLRQSGGQPEVIAALYPLLTSTNANDRNAAEMYIRQHTGLGDPCNAEDVAERTGWLREAQRMVATRGYDPTPAAIRNEYAPGDAALNKRLDAAGFPVGEGRFAQLGEPDVRPNIPADLSVSKGNGKRPTKLYQLARSADSAPSIDL